MPDIFSTNVVNGVVQDMKMPSSFLLDRFFGSISQDPTEEIHFDLIDNKRRLAPFVSPLVGGKVVQQNGHIAKTFRPAYIKDKRVFDTTRPLKRSAGEQLGGNLTPEQREQAILASELEDMMRNWRRRLEWMAAQALLQGSVTISGEDYPSVVVDFQRAAALEPAALTSTARWGQSAQNPLQNLKAWAALVLKQSGVRPTDVIMDVDTFEAFSGDTKVEKRLDLLRASGNLDFNAVQNLTEGAVFMGVIDGFNIWVYSGWYADDAGVDQPMWTAGRVVMTSPLIDGVQAFGAIRDHAAGFQATPFFVKSWLQDDPSVRFVMAQSAPLMVPRRVNASLAVNVL